MKCTSKQTKFQPSYKEWKCPACGSPAPEFGVMDSECDCDALHVTDYISCESTKSGRRCGYDTNGQALATRLLKQINRETCVHCEGKGWVKK